MNDKVKRISLALGLTISTASAWAVPFLAQPANTLGPLDGGSVTEMINSPGSSAAGAAILTFDLIGYRTVDGINCCTDTFKLSVNGSLLFSGGFDMGGGGSQFTNFIDPGVTIISTMSNGISNGGLTQFSVAHTLLPGNNTYLFDYGDMQGLGDEGWGLANISISADVSTTVNVPEPGTLALVGIAMLGVNNVRKRKQV